MDKINTDSNSIVNTVHSDKLTALPDDNGISDVAYMDMQCHLMIKEIETGEVLVNRRG